MLCCLSLCLLLITFNGNHNSQLSTLNSQLKKTLNSKLSILNSHYLPRYLSAKYSLSASLYISPIGRYVSVSITMRFFVTSCT